MVLIDKLTKEEIYNRLRELEMQRKRERQETMRILGEIRAGFIKLNLLYGNKIK